ncbi:hypothetical protein [Streptomyces sp. NBC_00572]|uniref:hypothetical protein n=1 Tax=Streptomyces sp. NBC_00572 TaxID=2903664 RepID=UPI00224FD0EF|nr:hypothetical protein [Streptomyces sp. NBC_00572]MCX4985786.1 hypothetical protein [Streptomyces sp. NBC_00572]
MSVDVTGIQYRGFFKYASLPWAEIDAIGVDHVAGGGGLLTAEVPLVRKDDGKELLLLVLAGYTREEPPVNKRVRVQISRMALAQESAVAD